MDVNYNGTRDISVTNVLQSCKCVDGQDPLALKYVTWVADADENSGYNELMEEDDRLQKMGSGLGSLHSRHQNQTGYRIADQRIAAKELW